MAWHFLLIACICYGKTALLPGRACSSDKKVKRVLFVRLVSITMDGFGILNLVFLEQWMTKPFGAILCYIQLWNYKHLREMWIWKTLSTSMTTHTTIYGFLLMEYIHSYPNLLAQLLCHHQGLNQILQSGKSRRKKMLNEGLAYCNQSTITFQGQLSYIFWMRLMM